MPKVIYVDIDETICFYDTRQRNYEKAIPDFDKIEKINNLYDLGNTIVYWTARGSTTGIDWYDITKQQLDLWGAKYHRLRCDKPYYDIFIDDKTLSNIDDL